jgi:hypothetical protein
MLVSAARRAPWLFAKARDLIAQLRRTMVEVRANRAKLEAELFRNRYHISSKNDDDLPIVR